MKLDNPVPYSDIANAHPHGGTLAARLLDHDQVPPSNCAVTWLGSADQTIIACIGGALVLSSLHEPPMVLFGQGTDEAADALYREVNVLVEGPKLTPGQEAVAPGIRLGRGPAQHPPVASILD